MGGVVMRGKAWFASGLVALLLTSLASAELVSRVQLEDAGSLGDNDIGLKTGAVSPNGDDILVAPMFAGEAHREVYLPEGRWHDYYSGKVYDGKQTITFTATLDQIPMFVKDGTLLPLAKPVQHIETDTVFELTPRCFGENCRDAKLYEDDGVTFDHQQGNFNTVTLTADGKLTREGDFEQVRYVLAE